MACFTFYIDLFRWTPAFQLFSCNNPGEYKLYYRDRLSDQSVTERKNISLTQRWKIYQAVRFPPYTVSESFKSIIGDFAAIAETQQDKTKLKKISERFNYNAILCFIMQMPSAGYKAVR